VPSKGATLKNYLFLGGGRGEARTEEALPKEGGRRGFIRGGSLNFRERLECHLLGEGGERHPQTLQKNPSLVEKEKDFNSGVEDGRGSGGDCLPHVGGEKERNLTIFKCSP